MTVEAGPREALIKELEKAFYEWRTCKHETPIVANLNSALRHCRDLCIPLTLIVREESIRCEVRRGMLPDTAGRNGRELADKNYSFDTMGEKPLIFEADGLVILAIRNKSGQQIGIFLIPEIVSLGATLPQEPSATPSGI